jgi:hypothetical protein
MPINATAEYYAAEKKFLEARSREEKIKYLEEMIKELPKHKGTSNLLSQLKHRLARLKKETSTKAKSRPRFTIRKEGAGQVCIIGLTNSGKSTLLKKLTGVDVEIADYPYTTKLPEVGMMFYADVQIQMIEVPSTFDSDSISILHSCDAIVCLLDTTKDMDEQKKDLIDILIQNRLGNKNIIFFKTKTDSDVEQLKKEIWESFSLIRVYTKPPGKKPIIPPITLHKNATIKDMAKEVHKDFLKNFHFARVFDDSPFSGQKVGLNYKLKDKDIVEIHTR